MRRRVDAQGAESILADVESRDAHLSTVFDRHWALTLMREAKDLMRARAAAEGHGAKLRIELLRARFGGSLTLREIAAQWEMDPDAVHRAYAKAREEFRVCFRQVVSCHTVQTEDSLDAECRRLLALLD